MTAARDRKRAQRAELARRGLGQYTVTWPVAQLEELREIEGTILARHERAAILGDLGEDARSEPPPDVLRRRQQETDGEMR